MNYTPLGFGIALFLLTGSNAAAAPPLPVEVTTCGTSLTSAGFLAADLDCTGFPDDAVVLTGGSLDLAGFTLTGGDAAAVECVDKCVVFSSSPGGTITGAAHDGISVGDRGVHSAKAEIFDITVTNNGSPDTADPGRSLPDAGITVWGRGSATITNVLSTQNIGDGLHDVGRAKVTVLDSAFTDNDNHGVAVDRVKMENVVISGNGGFGLQTSKAKVVNLQILNNGLDAVYDYLNTTTPGVFVSTSLKMFDSAVSGNTLGGIRGWVGKLKLSNTEISGNTGYGIKTSGKPVKLQDCMVINNTGVGIDVEGSAVKLRDSAVSGNSIGVSFVQKRVFLQNSSVTGNEFFGIEADNGLGFSQKAAVVVAKGGIVTGNGTDPSCGVDPTVCADLALESTPKFTYLAGTNECETSYVRGSGFPGVSWGICFFDCGNGAVTAGEICDDAGESATCDSDCTTAMCGDGLTNTTAGEECDDGGLVSDDGCDDTCVIEFCGDSITQPGIGEVCDDGLSTATCDEDCTLPLCGDGIRNKQAGEKCDDGNTNNGDGCDSACQKE